MLSKFLLHLFGWMLFGALTFLVVALIALLVALLIEHPWTR